MSIPALIGALGIGGGGLLVGEAYDRLSDIGDTAWDESQRIGAQTAEDINFTGYGVTGPAGQSTVDQFGNLNSTLTPEQDAYRQKSLGMANWSMNPNNALGRYGKGALNTARGMFGDIRQGSDGREQHYYDTIRAMQQPEEQRQNLALGDRLAAQGRIGLQTAQYGGSPEQLALDKARGESMNTASYQAIELARQQQMQQAQIASQLGQAGMAGLGAQGDLSRMYGTMQYAPQSAMLDHLNAGSNAYGYEDVARRQGGVLNSEAQMGGLEGMLGAGLGQANLMGNLGSSLIGGGMGMLGDWLSNWG